MRPESKVFRSRIQRVGRKDRSPLEGGARSQRIRSEQILRVFPDLTGAKILDVGCGFGDLYSFIKENGFKVSYFGIDVCEEMIEECRKRHPDASFHVGSVSEMSVTELTYDVSVASEIFMFPNPDWKTYVVRTVSKMFSRSRLGTAVNFLSTFSESPSSDSYYADPGTTLTLLMREISPWAVTIHDYRSNDFTIGLFRQPRVLAE